VRVRQASLQAGLQNAFDVYPDPNIAPNSFNGIQVYPSHSPFGMNGRFVFARIGYSF
jgi:iron complex outermembrane receptor protein